MAPSGRKPKPAGQAVTRHPRSYGWIDVEHTPFKGPALSPRRRDGSPWPDGIREKWAAWSSMPHCRLWGRSDWEFALDTLEIAVRFYDRPAVSWSTELRYRERVMGTTHDARQGLRIRYVAPVAMTPVGVTSIDEYRGL